MILYELYKVLDNNQLCVLYYRDSTFSYVGMYRGSLENIDPKAMFYLVDNIKVLSDGSLSITLIPN